MIKALICIKMIPDLDQVTTGDWKHGTHLSEPDVNYVNSIINYYDENAIELLLCLRDACIIQDNEEIKIDVITIGNEKSVKILKDAYAVGVDSCIHVKSTLNFRDNYFAVASVLQSYIKTRGDYDIIMCGESAAPYDNGQTAFALSYLLDIPCVSNVQELKTGKHGIEIVSKRNRLVCETIFEKPFIGIVGNISGLKLRLPTLKERLQSINKEIIQISIDELQLDEENLIENRGKVVETFFAEETKKNCHYIDLMELPSYIQLITER